jgi:hypothetical protein
MADDKVEISIDGLSRLQSAARDFARAEIERIERVVIEELRSRPAVGLFDEVHARHSWDEYCWALQQGPFDDTIILADMGLGSISGAFDSFLNAFILAEVEKLPKHALTFLSALAVEEDVDSDEKECLGCIWTDGIVKLVTEAVNEHGSRRKLDLIGPDRAHVIGYEIDGAGFVWAVLGCTLATSLVSGQVDAMIDLDADISDLAEEMIETFLAQVRQEEEGGIFVEFLDYFEEQFRSIIIECDVLPCLREMRQNLLEALDR